MRGVKYFDIKHHPQFSEDRILKSQVGLLYKKAIDPDCKTYFD
ncbi:MAG: hypothetical protein ABI416_14460 [Ginsengibacter sp.]